MLKKLTDDNIKDVVKEGFEESGINEGLKLQKLSRNIQGCGGKSSGLNLKRVSPSSSLSCDGVFRGFPGISVTR
jgi:hypothetical protein